MLIVVDMLLIVSPVFICAAIGWLWIRARRPFDSETITGLVVTIGTPCLVFDTLTRLDLNLATFGHMAVATVLCIGGIGLLAAPLLVALRLPVRAFLPAIMFCNAGNMGLPICLFAFGETGLALGVSYFGVLVMLQFTVGIPIASGAGSLRGLLSSPILYALAAAIAVIGLDITVPAAIQKTVRLLGGFTIPVMLIALGVSLGRLRVTSLRESAVVAVIRPALGLAVGSAVAWALDLGPVAAGVVILQSTMPVAVFSYLFAQRYGRSPEAVAGAVVISTLLVCAVLPLLLWLVLPPGYPR